MRALRDEIERFFKRPVAGRDTRATAGRQSQLTEMQTQLKELRRQQTAFSHESLAQFLAVAEAQRSYDEAVARKDLYDDEIAMRELPPEELAEVREWRAACASGAPIAQVALKWRAERAAR